MFGLLNPTKATAYWSKKKSDYYFDRSAQAILDAKYNSNRRRSSSASECSCGIGGCGDAGGCDAY